MEKETNKIEIDFDEIERGWQEEGTKNHTFSLHPTVVDDFQMFCKKKRVSMSRCLETIIKYMVKKGE